MMTPPLVRRALPGAILAAALLAAAPLRAQDDAASPDPLPTPRASTDATDPVDTAAPRSLHEPIVYKPPRRGSPRNKMAGATRGAPALPQPLALAPGHVGHTLEASPALYWYIDGVLPETARVVFTLTRDDAIEPLRELDLPHPARAGIQRVRLAEHGIALDRGIDYTWSISLMPDPQRHDDDVVSTAFVRRVGPGALAGRAPSAGAYAEAGLWYDALASLSDAIDTSGDPELREARNSLLRQAHLDAAVE
jgi:hypothetical protein